MSPPPVKLWVMPPCWGLPNASPFCLKVQTWLRLAEIPYSEHIIQGRPRSSTGKLPYLERPDGSHVADSSRILALLTREWGVTLDAQLSPLQQAEGLAYTHLLEDHLYWALVTERWADDAGWAEVKGAYFGHLPPVLRQLLPLFIRRQVVASLHGQGFGRMPRAWVSERAEADLAALAAVLDHRPFLLGEQPTSVDASAYGLLANLWLAPLDTALKRTLGGHPSLVAYVARMQARAWGEGAEPLKAD